MIWFFTRGQAQIDVEVHRGSEPGAYTLAVTYPDGAERIEQFDTATRLVTRALTIQQRRRRRVRFAAATARRALATVRQTIGRRLAATFGL